MKLNIGDYVRTKDGITQYKEYETTNGDKMLCMPVKDGSNGIFANIEDIIKSSPNIIDILEEHDFVRMEDRGIRFFEIEKDYQGKLSLRDIGWDEYEELDETNIPEIVSVITHEQMEQIEYKIK